MTETFRAQCRWEPRDFLKAHVVGDSVHVDTYFGDERVDAVSLSSAKARTFARGLLALADGIDGGEDPELKVQADDDAAQAIKAGDRVRVLYERADGANVRAGDVFTVRSISPHSVYTDRGGLQPGEWAFDPNKVEKVVDEPLKAADAPSSVAPDRVALLEEARRLAGELAPASAVLEFARFLAGE
ncbi:hypothetical protein ACIQMR_35455 [Streptomyces sp. NPDC091376]|uniref:hypothetical protein n=1 Tax=Streptomyces sp. NPDC091376 TaxID=3365994 RepID=UPI0037F2B48A